MLKNDLIGPAAIAAIPVRTCVICRQRFSQAQLTRYTMGVDGLLLRDGPERRPGRGWYCCGAPVCMEKIMSYKPKKRSPKNGAPAGR